MVYKIKKMFKNKIAQGEIFGVALMFVVIVIGIIIFGKISSFSPDREGELEKKVKYEILAQSSLETILKTASLCNVDGGSGDDTVQDLINVCLARSYGSDDVQAQCDTDGDGVDENILICAKALELLDNSLSKIFSGSSPLLGNILYKLEIDLEANTDSILTSINITNFGNHTYKGKVVTLNNYREIGFKKASSDLKPWATAQRDIKIVLGLYY